LIAGQFISGYFFHVASFLRRLFFQAGTQICPPLRAAFVNDKAIQKTATVARSRLFVPTREF